MKDYLRLFDECVFAFDGKNNVIEEKELGITSTIASVITPEQSATSLKCLQACPYTNTAMSFDIRVGGERVRADRWKWLPTAILRRGEAPDFSLETVAEVL